MKRRTISLIGIILILATPILASDEVSKYQQKCSNEGFQMCVTEKGECTTELINCVKPCEEGDKSATCCFGYLLHQEGCRHIYDFYLEANKAGKTRSQQSYWETLIEFSIAVACLSPFLFFAYTMWKKLEFMNKVEFQKVLQTSQPTSNSQETSQNTEMYIKSKLIKKVEPAQQKQSEISLNPNQKEVKLSNKQELIQQSANDCSHCDQNSVFQISFDLQKTADTTMAAFQQKCEEINL